MKNLLRSIILSDRVFVLILVFFIITGVFTTIVFINLERETVLKKRLDSQIKEMQLLDEKFTKLKETIEFSEKKVGLVRVDGVVSALEQILKSIGLRANAIRPLNKEDIEGYILEDAEIEIKDTDLNSIVNLLYKIENSRFPLRIKETSLKTTFENSDRFILKITVSLIRPGRTSENDNSA